MRHSTPSEIQEEESGLTPPFSPIPSNIPHENPDNVFTIYKDETTRAPAQDAGRHANLATIDVVSANGTLCPSQEALTSPVTPPPLETELRKALQKHNGETEYRFLPLDAFDNIIHEMNIMTELRRAIPRCNADALAGNVMGNDVLETTQNPDSKRRIFAILVLMEKAAKIVQFINLGICDHQLPFKFKEEGIGGFALVEDRYGNELTADLFKRPVPRESFRRYQWQLLAPFFKLSRGPCQPIEHHDLNAHPGLPFLESKPTYEREFDLGMGGYAQVRRVKIHPAHHNLTTSLMSGEDVYFAVKRLHRSEDEYRQCGEPVDYEAQILKRLNNIGHENIIRLLGTYSYGNHFHMIFPWANGNLQDFWKTHHPDPTNLRANGVLASWLCMQMIGLASALMNVHDTRNAGGSTQRLSGNPDHRNHGRHGDIKPENILWLETKDTETEEGSLGVLKLADFGLADFHSRVSKSKIKAKGGTGTYEAPEFELREVVSQRYDMWSFGCVLIEFTVWYVDGWEGVDRFSERRSAETASGIAMDNFYNVRLVKRRSWDPLKHLRGDTSAQRDRRADVKPSVTAIRQHLLEESRTSNACSDFVMDLLDVVEDDLLRMHPENRTDCAGVLAKLTTISASCLEDPQYFSMLRKPVRKKATHRSELVSSRNTSERKAHSYLARSLSGRNSVEGFADDISVLTNEPLQENNDSDERAPLMEGANSNSRTEERDGLLGGCIQYVWRVLSPCLGTRATRTN